MNEHVSETAEKKWRNTCRVSRGRRKGQFMKKSSVVTKKKEEAIKRLCETTNKEVNKDVLSGREVVEPRILAREMWCTNCKIPLSFDFATERVQRGLATVYSIKCCKCQMERSVRTNELFEEKHNLFTVNAKAAMGIIDSGIGESQFNSLLSTMNIAPVSTALLKRYERFIGEGIEAVAMESCSQSLEDEKFLTKSVNDIVKDE